MLEEEVVFQRLLQVEYVLGVIVEFLMHIVHKVYSDTPSPHLL